MSKKYLFAVLVILIVFIGCAKEDGTKKSGDEPFVGGKVGLSIDFVEDAPPPEVTDGGNFPFDVVVKLENKGEHTVLKEDAIVSISGILPEDFNKAAADLTKNPDENLEATKKDAEGNVIEGTITYVEFKDFNYLGSLSGRTPFPIKADVCYNYGTIANAKLCVLENPLKPEGSDVCKINEEKKVHNSGAPVQVTSFEETTRGSDKIAFTFKIQHVGDGMIFKRATDCNSSIRTDNNKIYASIDTGVAGLSCSGLADGTNTTGYVNLYGGDRSRTIVCTQDVTSISIDFEKVTVINLEYDYEESKQTEVLVKHLIE